MNNEFSMKRVLKAAGIFAASIIGAGFATGQEIMQFFTSQGSNGIIGTLVTTVLFSIIGAMLMTHGFVHQLNTHQKILDLYFGKSGKLIDGIIEFFIFGILVIMISGSGSLFHEFMGTRQIVGRLVSGIIILLIVCLGTDRLSSVIAVLGPTIICSLMIVGIYGMFMGSDSVYMAASLNLIKATDSWLLSAILYPCFNSICLVYILCNTGSQLRSKKESVWGGILGGILFGVGVMIVNLGLLKNISLVYQYSIPSVVLAKKMGKFVGLCFPVLVFVGICTGSSPMLWNNSRRLSRENKKMYRVWAAVISVIVQFLAVTDFKVLVNTIYPYSGVVGFFFLIYLAIRGAKSKILNTDSLS